LQRVTKMRQTISALPERRSPNHANGQGSEGKAPEFTAPKVNPFYSPLLPKSIPVTGNNSFITSRNTLRRSLTTARRNPVCANALGWGLKLDSHQSCSGIPKTDTESKSQFKGLSIRRWRNPRGTYHPFGTGKAVEQLSPVNEVPARNGSLIGFKGEKSFDLPE
jgi:hypothetical protein